MEAKNIEVKNGIVIINHNNNNDETSDFDGFWKDIIEEYWQEFLKKFLPKLYKDADLKSKPEFLNKELRDVLNLPELSEEHNPPLFVDELIKIPMKNGEEKWLLLHIEVQGKGGENISYRMFLYYCLIFARYRKKIVSLAILTSRRPKKEDSPGIYKTLFYGTSIEYKYNYFEAYKVTDKELEAGENKFDLFLLAVKFAMRSKHNEQKKFSYLKKITEILYQKGFTPRERREILRYVNYIVGLSDKELKQEYFTYVNNFEGGRTVAKRMSILDEVYYEKGIEKGREGLEKERKEALEQGRENILQKLLSRGMLTEEQVAEASTWDLEPALATM